MKNFWDTTLGYLDKSLCRKVHKRALLCDHERSPFQDMNGISMPQPPGNDLDSVRFLGLSGLHKRLFGFKYLILREV